jgi:hypothetical protein
VFDSDLTDYVFINEKVCLVTKVREPVVYVTSSMQNFFILIYGQDIQNCCYIQSNKFWHHGDEMTLKLILLQHGGRLQW